MKKGVGMMDEPRQPRVLFRPQPASDRVRAIERKRAQLAPREISLQDQRIVSRAEKENVVMNAAQ
jgi:hypothetical protein